MAKFEGHTGPVAGMSFSENGYYLATCAADGVKLWDLRKLKNFRTLAPPEDAAATTSVHFDKCGPLRQAGRPGLRPEVVLAAAVAPHVIVVPCRSSRGNSVRASVLKY